MAKSLNCLIWPISKQGKQLPRTHDTADGRQSEILMCSSPLLRLLYKPPEASPTCGKRLAAPQRKEDDNAGVTSQVHGTGLVIKSAATERTQPVGKLYSMSGPDYIDSYVTSGPYSLLASSQLFLTPSINH